MKCSTKETIYAAISGDIAGSQYENRFPEKLSTTVPFEHYIEKGHFTDDTVLTIAVIDAILHDRAMGNSFKDWASRYYNAGFSKNFKETVIYPETFEPGGCHSSSNGALMMLAPFISANVDYEKAFEAVNVTHNCSECRSLAYELIHYALSNEITPFIEFVLQSQGSYGTLKDEKKFDITAFGTLREAIIIVNESCSFNDAMAKSIQLGGDTDTRTCIVGMLAASKFGVPSSVIEGTKRKLPQEFIELIEQM